jgi:hypothetical protein
MYIAQCLGFDWQPLILGPIILSFMLKQNVSPDFSILFKCKIKTASRKNNYTPYFSISVKGEHDSIHLDSAVLCCSEGQSVSPD